MWKTGQFLGSVLLRGGGGVRGPDDAARTHECPSSDNITAAAVVLVAPLLQKPVDLVLSLSALHEHCLELLALLVQQNNLCNARVEMHEDIGTAKACKISFSTWFE